MSEKVENKKLAEVKKLLELAYVEAKYETLEETALFVKAAIESLKVWDAPSPKTSHEGIVVQFPDRKSG